MQKKAKNSSYMKFANRQSVLNIIRNNPVSRAELARMTGLTRAAITLIVDDLIKDKVVVEKGVSEAEYGRKPILLEINPKRYYAVGLDISRDGCSLGIVNINGQVIIKKHIDLDSCSSASGAIRIIAEEIHDMINASKIRSDSIMGIGATSPGPVDIYSGTILNPPNFEMWHNINIVKELQEETGYKVLVENISNARAIAEKSYGMGREFNSFILIVVDEGVGSGIIINNEVYHGVEGFGSEFSHTSINFDGRFCSCGNRGCIETYASTPNILKEMFKEEEDIRSWREVVDSSEDGDERCLEAIGREALYLSSGIINIMNLLELKAVIIAGDINYKPGMLLDKISEKTMASSITRDIHNILVLNSSITEDSEIISPVSIVIEDYFSLNSFHN